MVQNLTSTVATNATETYSISHYDLNLAAIIAAIALLITLLGILYKFGQQVGEIRGVKQVIEAKLEFLDQKYNTKEEIQKIESNLKDKADKNYVDMRLDYLLAERAFMKVEKQSDDIDGKIKFLRDMLDKASGEFKEQAEKELGELEKDVENTKRELERLKHEFQNRPRS